MPLCYPEYHKSSHLADFKSEFEQISPQVVLDMIPYTKEDALTLMKTFKGLAQRVVSINSIDVYRAYGVILGKDPSPTA